MPYGQRYMGRSTNGMSDGLYVGSQTLANFVSGNFDRPMYKIVGAIPNFDVNRTMPLRIWEIIEINWKDFAQYIGPLQSFGWEFQPGLYDAKNNAQKTIDELKLEIEELQKNLEKENDKLFELQKALAEKQATLDKFLAMSSTTLTVEDTHKENLKGAPQASKFDSDNKFATTIIALQAKVLTLETDVSNQQGVVDGITNDIDEKSKELAEKEKEFDDKYSHLSTDELGLTDAFMHAVYTQFLKHFWAYKLGQTNPELWCNLVNDFFGNHLPMLYKAARVIAESKDFSTAQWQEGGATSSSTSNNKSKSNTAAMGDGSNMGQTGSIAAASAVPQSRMQLNARNTEFANNVQNQESTSQDGTSTTNFMDQESNSQATNALNSINNGKQWMLDPLKVWNQVLTGEGLFQDLWDKAMNFGLFDLTM